MNNLVFTRLLYPKNGIKSSIKNSFQEKRSYEEFVFWCSELYYSGYEENTFQILFEIYYDYVFIEDDDNKINEFIEINYEKWLKSYKEIKLKTKDNLLLKITEKLYFAKYNLLIEKYMKSIRNGEKKITIYRGKKPEWLNIYKQEEKPFIYSLYKTNLQNIIILSYNLNKNKNYTIENMYKLIEESNTIKIEKSKHIKNYTNEHHKLVYDILKSLIKLDEKKELVRKKTKKEVLSKELIAKMMSNYSDNEENPRFIIRNYRKYKIIYNEEMSKDDKKDLLKKYNYNWLYYACECPLWNKRIKEYRGKQNHSNEEIEFDEEDDETGYSLFDKFHLKYQYEPDEQPKGFTEHILFL